MLLEMHRSTDKVLVWSDEKSYLVEESSYQIDWVYDNYLPVSNLVNIPIIKYILFNQNMKKMMTKSLFTKYLMRICH